MFIKWLVIDGIPEGENPHQRCLLCQIRFEMAIVALVVQENFRPIKHRNFALLMYTEASEERDDSKKCINDWVMAT